MNRAIDWTRRHAAIVRSRKEYLRPIGRLSTIDRDPLIGIGRQKDQRYRHTERFLSGLTANKALLRSTGRAAKGSPNDQTAQPFHNPFCQPD